LFSLTCLIPTSNSYYLVFTYAPIFSLGISLVSLFKKRDKVNYLIPLFLLAFIFIKFGLLLLVILFITSIIILTFTIEVKPLFFLGKISYSLYLTHSLIQIITAGLLKRLFIKPLTNELLFLLVEIAVAILTGYIFYLLIEKPSKIVSKNIKYTSDDLTVSAINIPD
jgi:peptidoglycan/LPS O-acetylase OafA/YrhL